MRIFYGFDVNLAQYLNQSDKDIWTVNIRDTLVDMDHEVINFDYSLGEFFLNLEKTIPGHVEYSKKHKQKVVDAFLAQIKKTHEEKPIDILLSYFYDHFMDSKAIEEVKAMGIVTINYNCNASFQFDLIKDISPSFDHCLTVEDFKMDDYKAINANPVYFQEAANINHYKPYDLEKVHDVVFIGQSYGDRSKLASYLHKNGVNLDVFGLGWRGYQATNKILLKNLFYKIFNRKRIKVALNPKFVHDRLDFDDMVKLYSKTKIAINFSTCGNTHMDSDRVTQIRLRDFEAPACKVCYMTEYSKELEDFYDVGKEIICYESKEELLDKIKFYLNNDSARNKVAEAGYNRVIKDHSWQKRFEKLFNDIGLK